MEAVKRGDPNAFETSGAVMESEVCRLLDIPIVLHCGADNLSTIEEDAAARRGTVEDITAVRIFVLGAHGRLLFVFRQES